MRVGLNATCYNDRPSGARQRFIGIYGELIKRNPQIDFVVYEPADCEILPWFGQAPNVHGRRTPVPSTGPRLNKFMRAFGYWRRALAADRLDLFEQFNLPLVKAPNCPTVLTVHDMRQIHCDAPPLTHAFYAHVWRRSLDGADHVITVSNTMRNEILDFRPSTQVTTIYNGLDLGDFEIAEDEELRKMRLTWNIPEKFVLAVGHFEERKNYLTLIKAVGQLRNQGREVHLVVVGNDSGNKKEVELEIQKSAVADRISILSDIPDRDLKLLFIDCTLFVFPSYYEGFGIPIIEAMAAGRPIVLSDIPIFREIAEDKGVYFGPHDSNALAKRLWEIWSRSANSSDGNADIDQRLKEFRFSTLAEKVEQLYSRLI